MKLRSGLLGLTGIGLLFVPAYSAPTLQSEAYVQAVTHTTAVVRLIDRSPRSLGLEWTGLDGVKHSLSPDTARRRHHFDLSGLEAGQRYSFRVVDTAGAEIDAGSFKTRSETDADGARFAVIGDSGQQPWWFRMQKAPIAHWGAEWGILPAAQAPSAVARRLLQEKPDFVLHVGDVVYPNGQHQHYTAGFFLPFADLLKTTCMYLVLGNHDVMNSQGQQFLQNFAMPTNDVTGDERCFSFREGPVRIICLDVNQHLSPEHPTCQFLLKTLKAAEEPWTVVLTHFPYLSTYRTDDEHRKDFAEHLIPMLEKYGVDLYMCGHDHNYQRFDVPDQNLVQVVTGGGGKRLYSIDHVHPHCAKVVKEFHYCMIDVKGPTMTLRAIKTDGVEIDVYKINKKERVENGRIVLDPARKRDQRIAQMIR